MSGIVMMIIAIVVLGGAISSVWPLSSEQMGH